MTVAELIEQLKRFDGNLIVLCPGSEEDTEPNPRMENHKLDYMYYDGHNFHTIKSNTPFVLL